ncbi:MAG: hypothetical protein WCS70_13160 [Verrucomicrobiota bacterium]
MRHSLWLLIGLLTGCHYSHVGEARATFRQTGQVLTLRVDRHCDTVMGAPDVEEDQRLILELSAYTVGVKWPVPSPNAVARFTVTRFGPSSEGTDCTGYIILKSVTDKKVVADLSLDITAHTSNGGYTQHVKYRGEHTFVDGAARGD